MSNDLADFRPKNAPTVTTASAAVVEENSPVVFVVPNESSQGVLTLGQPTTAFAAVPPPTFVRPPAPDHHPATGAWLQEGSGGPAPAAPSPTYWKVPTTATNSKYKRLDSVMENTKVVIAPAAPKQPTLAPPSLSNGASSTLASAISSNTISSSIISSNTAVNSATIYGHKVIRIVHGDAKGKEDGSRPPPTTTTSRLEHYLKYGTVYDYPQTPAAVATEEERPKPASNDNNANGNDSSGSNSDGSPSRNTILEEALQV